METVRMGKTTPLEKCLRLIESYPDEPLRVYSIQTSKAVQVMQATGALQCSRETLLKHSELMDSEMSRVAYDWMAKQMHERVALQHDHYPIWAWLKRPDLRRKERKRVAGNILISALVPRSRMIISDFLQFHNCLNGGPITISEADALEFERAEQFDTASEYIRKSQESWLRIFDLRAISGEQPFWRLGRRVILQACIDKICIHEVQTLRTL